MIYLDTSALVKVFVGEEGSDRVRTALNGQALRTVSIAFVEMLSALTRKSALSEAERMAATRWFLMAWPAFRALSTDNLLKEAGILARTHGLRAFDAVHLAAARSLGRPRSTLFMVFDTALATAAAREGFQLLP